VERNKLLQADEEMWRHKSRAIWLQKGNLNTFFFHHFVNHRRNRKTIWKIHDGNDTLHIGQEALMNEALRHFKEFYANTGHNTIIDQLSTIMQFPHIVEEVDR
jgi:hypothetical protein